ncbi:hypothetical protein KKA14_01025, partial [bacterium]|nr:hypothetical protein [bacterium]
MSFNKTSPAPSLSFLIKPEWRDVKCSEKHWLTIGIIEDNIISTKPTGTVDLASLQNSTNFIDKLVQDMVPAEKNYIQIEDYTGLQGVS